MLFDTFKMGTTLKIYQIKILCHMDVSPTSSHHFWSQNKYIFESSPQSGSTPKYDPGVSMCGPYIVLSGVATIQSCEKRKSR